jgi:Tfp pilus assembly protein PilW
MPEAAPTGKRAALEDGYTLVEVLVASVLGLVVFGAGVIVFTAAVHSQPQQNARGVQVQHARTAAEAIVRELRQGVEVPAATATQLSVVTYVKSATCGGASAASAIPCRVTYGCASGACTRVEANPDGSAPGPARTVVSGLSSSDVFSYSPTPTAPAWVGITLAFPAGNGDDAITVEDGAALRNPS